MAQSAAATGATVGAAFGPIGAGIGAVAGLAVDLIGGARKKKKAERAKQEAIISAAAESYENEGTRNDLEAAKEAAIMQEQVAIERVAQAEAGEAEAKRQGDLVEEAGELDIDIQQTTTTERRQRRKQFYEGMP